MGRNFFSHIPMGQQAETRAFLPKVMDFTRQEQPECQVLCLNPPYILLLVLPYSTSLGHDEIFKNVCGLLRGEEALIIGIYGMGVGRWEDNSAEKN